MLINTIKYICINIYKLIYHNLHCYHINTIGIHIRSFVYYAPYIDIKLCIIFDIINNVIRNLCINVII